MSTSVVTLALVDLVRPFRRRVWAGAALAALGGAGLALGAAAWAARLGWTTGPGWVLGAWTAAGAAVAAALLLAARRMRETTALATAGTLEGSGIWRRGALRGLLGLPAPGTSDALFGAAETAAVRMIGERGRAGLGVMTAEWRRSGRAAGALALLGAGAFASARPLQGPGAALWHPAHALAATFAPVRLRADLGSVDRGASVTLRIDAADRREATLWLRAPGEGWREQPVALDQAGHAEIVTAPLAADLYARATSAGRSSDTLVVHVRIPAFLGSVTVTAHYPRYLKLDPEPLPLDGDTVLLPAGTRLITTGQATAALGAGHWSGPDGQLLPIAIDAGHFSAEFTPARSGVYQLALTTAEGPPLAGAGVILPLRLLADAPPSVDIPVPGSDTVIGPELRLPLVLEARDDHGLAHLEVETRGAGLPDRVETVPLPDGSPDHVAIPWTLDLNARGVAPGDTIQLIARVRDNAPEPHRAESRVYRLRLGTPQEARDAARAATRALEAGFDSVSASSRSVARSTADLAQERTRADANGAKNGDQALSYEAAQRAEAVARGESDLQRQAGQLRDAVAKLGRDARAAGLDDPAFQAQLSQIQAELDRALTPELRQRLADLEQAVHDLDADRTRAALQDLAAQQTKLREALDRSRELFRRAATEGDLANLGAEAKELTERQGAWNQALGSTDSAKAAAAEHTLATRADSMAASLGRLAPQLAADGRQEAMQQAAGQAAAAAAEMRDAAASAGAGKASTGQAVQSGKAAEEKLRPLAGALQQQRSSLQQQWREDVTGQLDRALADVARLSDGELALSESFRLGEPVATLRDRQAAIEEGAGRVLEQLRQAAGKNAIVSPLLSLQMVQALDEMRRSREALSSALPDLREGSERAGQSVDGLNSVAYLLLRNRDDVSGSGSGSGLPEAMQRMQLLAGQQGALGQAAEGLLPMFGSGKMGMQLSALGGRQQAIADALERMRGEGQLPGAGQLADEAKDLARRMAAGQLDRATIERQQKLFHRMLDAGRTLQGSDADPDRERTSTTSEGDSVHTPAPLPADLSRAGVRMPSWNDLQRYSPEERRLVADYFRRLLGGTP